MFDAQEAKKEVLMIIKKMKKYNTFGGNCGMFALALGRYVKEKYKDSPVFLLATGLDGDEKGDLPNDGYEDLSAGDYDLYHVMYAFQDPITSEGYYFDGSGVYTNSNVTKYINDFCKKYYNNPYPTYAYLDYNEKTKSIIRQNTNWSISDNEFYEKILRIVNKE